MKIWICILFLSLGITAHAQHVISNGVAYEVKGKAIYKEGVDITSTLLKGEKDQIFQTFKKQQRGVKDAESARKRLEKAARKSEKSEKRAVKELRNKQKAQDKYNKATKKLQQNQAKYNRLKERGKLSPNAEDQWLKKIDRFKKDVEKRRKNL